MKYRSYVAALVLVLALCAIAFFSIYSEVKKQTIHDLNARQIIHARQAARGIQDHFDYLVKTLVVFSHHESIVRLENQGKKIMADYREAYSEEVKSVTRLDARGRILYTTPFNQKAIGTDISGQEHVREILQTQKPVISDVFQAVQGFQAIALHVPVFRQGRFDGTIGLLVSIDHVADKYVKEIRIGKNGYAWMMTQRGIEISCPVPGHVGRSVFDTCRDFPEIIAMATEMLMKKEGVTTYPFDKIRGDRVEKVVKHAVYLPVLIGNTFWSIVVATPEDEVLLIMDGFRKRLLVIFAALFLIGCALTYFLVRAVVIFREQEKRKTVEASLEKSEEKLSLLMDGVPVLLAYVDADLRFVYTNRAYADWYGRTREDIAGKRIDDLLDQDVFRRALPYYQKALSGKDVVFENKTYDKDKRERYVSVHIVPHHHEGMVVGFFASIMDVTEQRLAEEKQRETESLFIAFMNNLPAAVLIKDNDLRPVYVNNRFREIFPADDWMGKTPVETFPPDVAGPMIENDRQALSSGFVRYEEKWENLHGLSYVFETSKFRIEREGKTPFLGCIIMDVTDRKRAEEERHDLQERLQRAEKMEALGTLAGGVAHDLNNVLGVLVGFSELLAEKLPKDSPLYRYADHILKSSMKGTAIIEDLLTLARRGVTISETVNLNRIVADYFRTPEFEKLQSFHPGVKMTAMPEEGLLHIKGSPIHLGKTVMNLISNAVEAISGSGEVTIRTENRYLDKPVRGYDDLKEGDYVVLMVSDTGSGISAGDLAKIFEPFYTKKVMGKSGTGLGLAVVWGTVKDHNGYIDVQSEEGRGSVFSLYFPATRENPAGIRTALSADSYRGRGESILVVDDVPAQRELAARMLERLGYRVQTVAGGEEAVECLKIEKMDLVLLDMIMDPGIDGMETYRRILEIHPGQKAIIVSGFSETERVRKTQQMGAGAFVRKPYLLEKIGLAVRRELDRK
ncbi:MAG: PAS domain-containing protein [Deltaproteobacteria bacterium]